MRLHGLKISNYYNVVKLGLLEKGLAFEEVQARPSQEEPFVNMSPMGKIPVLEDDGTFLSESMAILRYLDLKSPDTPLYPSDPALAARAQAIHSIVDLYVDAAARTLLRAAFFGAETTPEAISTVSEKLDRAAKALGKLLVLEPFAAGNALTHADLSLINTVPLATQIMTNLGAKDPFEGISGLSAYFAMMEARPTVNQVLQDRAQALEQIMGG